MDIVKKINKEVEGAINHRNEVINNFDNIISQAESDVLKDTEALKTAISSGEIDDYRTVATRIEKTKADIVGLNKMKESAVGTCAVTYERTKEITKELKNDYYDFCNKKASEMLPLLNKIVSLAKDILDYRADANAIMNKLHHANKDYFVEGLPIVDEVRLMWEINNYFSRKAN